MFIAFIHFIANLILAGTVLRIIEAKWPNSGVGKALTFAY